MGGWVTGKSKGQSCAWLTGWLVDESMYNVPNGSDCLPRQRIFRTWLYTAVVKATMGIKEEVMRMRDGSEEQSVVVRCCG